MSTNIYNEEINSWNCDWKHGHKYLKENELDYFGASHTDQKRKAM